MTNDCISSCGMGGMGGTFTKLWEIQWDKDRTPHPCTMKYVNVKWNECHSWKYLDVQWDEHCFLPDGRFVTHHPTISDAVLVFEMHAATCE